MKLSRIVGKNLPEFPVQPDYTRPEPHSSVGIEVEVEGIRARTDDFKYWDVSRDGSLQGGVEFISAPIWGTAINDALAELGSYFAIKKPYLSFRTSVHVHLNVLDISEDELCRLISLYSKYEPALFRLHSEWNRYDNIFCVPAYKSTQIQEGYNRLMYDIKHQRVSINYVGWKYSAMNPNSVGELGTLEFRHMGGTDDMDKLNAWINILLQLKWAAKNCKADSPAEEVWGDYYKQLDIKPIDIDRGKSMIEYMKLQHFTLILANGGEI